MKLTWTPQGWAGYLSCQSDDPEVVRKINGLIKDIGRDHFTGLGKPDPLKGDFQGWWSRRMTNEHRLIYRVTGKDADKQLEIAQCRYRYGKSWELSRDKRLCRETRSAAGAPPTVLMQGPLKPKSAG